MESIKIISQAVEWKNKGHEVAIATVVETWGSSPRPVGSQMIINDDMDILGSVSGGCIEGAIAEEAQQILKNNKPKLLNYGISNKTAWDVGLACGGKIQVFVEKITDTI
tara:strand:+ start:357 stop:683 length:327 start_codon:yes stop_codon:yes gene_type:complete